MEALINVRVTSN